MLFIAQFNIYFKVTGTENSVKWKQLLFSFIPPKTRMKITVPGGKEQYQFPNHFGYQLALSAYDTQSTVSSPVERRAAVSGSGKRRTAVCPWVQNTLKLKGNWKQTFMHPGALMVVYSRCPHHHGMLCCRLSQSLPCAS